MLEIDFELGVIVAVTFDGFVVDAACDVNKAPKRRAVDPRDKRFLLVLEA